ncbi:hypothetical protein DV738_g350, partial [Chaetothyriales sp. CBS 135597]
MSSYASEAGFPLRSASDVREPRRVSDAPAMAQSSPDSEQKRSRGRSTVRDGYSSDPGRYSGEKQPINDAITSAFAVTPASSIATTTTISPELLAQITSHVIQQLRSANLSVASESTPSHQYVATNLSPEVRTAPSLDSSSQSQTLNPEQTRVAAPDSAAQGQNSPRLGRAVVDTPPPSRRSTEEGIRAQQQSPSGNSGRSADNGKDDHTPRPKGPQGISKDEDFTIVERAWGELFTEQGEGTARLSQFLRGIALHLITDYEPKHSLVITPEKMQRYYEETKLDNDTYPWQVIFDDRTSSISRMFREISAQHHLVQPHGKENERPDVPGLTPRGFATWATLLIRAHPSQEFERLAKTARDMPISNPDDPKERFPKEISRRLFPEHSNETIAARLQRAISVHCNVSFNARQDGTDITRLSAVSATSPANPKRSSISASEQGQPAITLSAQSNESIPQIGERLGKVVSHTDSGVVIDDDTPAAPPLERKRKPYVAAPGGGKSHEDQTNPAAVEVKPATTENKAASSLLNPGWSEPPKPRPTPITVHHPKSTLPPPPLDIPESRRRRNSTNYRDQPSGPAPHRTRSPSVGQTNGHGRLSEPDYGYNSSYAPGSSSLDSGDIARRYREYDEYREKHSTDRYDPARMAAVDNRGRERGESRPRGHSISTSSQAVYLTDDDYYKAYGGYPPHSATIASSSKRDVHGNYVPGSAPSSAAYPPTAFRDPRADVSDSGLGSGRRTKDSDGFGDFSRNQMR